MPYDTDVVELTEEHDYATREQALGIGLRLWGEHRFFEAHECLEDVWHPAPAHDREFWKGVIQVAVGCVHHQRGNADGCVTLLRRATEYLAPYPSPHHGVDVAELRRRALAMADRVAQEGTVALDYPTVPVVDGGAFVGATPDEGPHPLRDEPPWAVRDRTTDAAPGVDDQERP